MKLKGLLAYMDCVPVEVTDGENRDEALLNMEVKLRVKYTSGTYNQIVEPEKITMETIPGDRKPSIVINTSRAG